MIKKLEKSNKNTGLVVKSNRIVTALQSLSLIEMRLIQLAIVDARDKEEGLDSDTPLSIHAKRYADAFDVASHTSYEVLKEAGKGLVSRQFTFLSERENKVLTNWVQQVEYIPNEGRIEIIFTKAVVDEITRLSSHFTKYALERIATLNSIYSVRLYELLVKWVSAKKTNKFEYELFREQMGLGVSDNLRMSDFKRRVLDPSVKEINEKTDLKVKYDQVKNGTRITHFTFTIHTKENSELNKQRDVVKESNNESSTIDGLSDKQLWRITRHKSFIKTYGSMAKGDAGRSWEAYSRLMVDEIKIDHTRFNRKRPIREYLKGSDDEYDFS